MSKKLKAEEYKENFEEETASGYYEYENNLEQAEDEYYEDAKKTFRKIKTFKYMGISNIIFVLMIIIIIVICIDIICVTKYNVGPFFAIKTKTYNDGGTKEYYGLGYKVIKYSEKKGRQDIEIGTWKLEYLTDPVIIDDIDLAIEFQNKPQITADKYYKKYIKISSVIKQIDKDKNKIILEYKDQDNKYTLEIKCEMQSPKEELNNHSVNEKVTIKGTVLTFLIKEEKKPNSVTITNCIVE